MKEIIKKILMWFAVKTLPENDREFLSGDIELIINEEFERKSFFAALFGASLLI